MGIVSAGLFLCLCAVLTYVKYKSNKLGFKKIEELHQIKARTLREHCEAKDLKSYGSMGHCAELLVQINKELEVRGLPVVPLKTSFLVMKSNNSDQIDSYPRKLAVL